eukprot:2200837-Alexandrium_andersonii.AAC.1
MPTLRARQVVFGLRALLATVATSPRAASIDPPPLPLGCRTDLVNVFTARATSHETPDACKCH